MDKKIIENLNSRQMGVLNDIVVRLCLKKNWNLIYKISTILGIEIGIIVDNNDNCWIEWGEVSIVKHSPPIGAELPLKLWLHTHPNGNAYWSEIDQQALYIFKSIFEKAIVLGNDGYLIASHTPPIGLKGKEDNSEIYATKTGWVYHTFVRKWDLDNCSIYDYFYKMQFDDYNIKHQYL